MPYAPAASSAPDMPPAAPPSMPPPSSSRRPRSPTACDTSPFSAITPSAGCATTAGTAALSRACASRQSASASSSAGLARRGVERGAAERRRAVAAGGGVGALDGEFTTAAVDGARIEEAHCEPTASRAHAAIITSSL